MGKSHVHKYRRLNIGRKVPYYVMQCSLPGCNSYVPMRSMESAPALIGKLSICNSCGDRFQLDSRSLKQAKPTCKSCVKSPLNEKLKAASKFFEEMEGKIEENDAG